LRQHQKERGCFPINRATFVLWCRHVQAHGFMTVWTTIFSLSLAGAGHSRFFDVWVGLRGSGKIGRGAGSILFKCVWMLRSGILSGHLWCALDATLLTLSRNL
jgi:hypothetical protein